MRLNRRLLSTTSYINSSLRHQSSQEVTRSIHWNLCSLPSKAPNMASAKKGGFHPDRSTVGDDTLGDFLRAEISGTLTEVPGIGPATVKALNTEGITTTHQLLGKFLSMKDEGVEPVELAERFFLWLDHVGSAPGSRSGVVLSVAEKLNLTFTGIFDRSAYNTEA